MLLVVLVRLAATPLAHAVNDVASNSDVLPSLRPVRVLIVSESSRLRLNSQVSVLLGGKDGLPLDRLAPNEEAMISATNDGAIQLGDRLFPADLYASTEGDGRLRLSAEKNGEWTLPLEFTGALRVFSTGSNSLSAVNQVDVEEYVAGVVAHEVWPTFHDEALRAQSVVSRSYVLYQMMRRPSSDYDVVATQGAQVYRGVRLDEVGQRAREAAEYTRGIVLTHRDEEGKDRLFCAYYSAACGGCSQPAYFLGPEGDVGPLRGGVRCNYCRIAPGDVYRWGPVRLPVTEVLRRLSARFPEAASLGKIDSIETVESTEQGRPVTLRVQGGGVAVRFLAERFRLGIDGGLVRSTDCRIRVDGDEVVFEDGKGFGHGLGLCQWGMQGQALAGRRAAQILTYYFPGAILTRIY